MVAGEGFEPINLLFLRQAPLPVGLPGRKIGAEDGSRTRALWLEARCATVTLHPHGARWGFHSLEARVRSSCSRDW